MGDGDTVVVEGYKVGSASRTLLRSRLSTAYHVVDGRNAEGAQVGRDLRHNQPRTADRHAFFDQGARLRLLGFSNQVHGADFVVVSHLPQC